MSGPVTTLNVCLLDWAYNWLCRSRKNHPSSSDIWHLRPKWEQLRERIAAAFQQGTYRFAVQSKITLASGETIAMWSACDALVIKLLTRIMQETIQPLLPRACYHVKGHGGLRGAVQEVLRNYPHYRFFCKTDVESYYDSIDHHTLMFRLS
ncbi:MAG: hypothetical protein ACLP5H_22980 [Desulfomonilaceae bacterium]